MVHPDGAKPVSQNHSVSPLPQVIGRLSLHATRSSLTIRKINRRASPSSSSLGTYPPGVQSPPPLRERFVRRLRFTFIFIKAGLLLRPSILASHSLENCVNVVGPITFPRVGG